MRKCLFLALICCLLLTGGCGNKEQEPDDGIYSVEVITNEPQSADVEETTIPTVELTPTEEPSSEEEVETSEEETRFDDDGNYIPVGYAKLEVEELLQNPELPTGCESVSLTALLKYYGFDWLEKTYIADNYLIYSKTGDCADGFIGSPYSPKGSGCFANVMRQTADNFLYEQGRGSGLAAYDFSGAELWELYQSLDYFDPVLIWGTIDMVQPSIDKSDLKVGDNTFYHYEHCLVLMGYNLEENVFYIMDPLIGIVERDINEFYDIYCKIGKYAVVIWPGDPVPSSENGFGL